MKPLETYQSLGEALEHALLQTPDAIGLIEVNRDELTTSLTYQDIFDQACHVTKLLQSHDVQSGDHCGIVMSNQSKWNTSAIGVFFAGGVLVPLDYKLSPEEQIDLILHADLKLLIIEYPLWKKILQSKRMDELSSIAVLVTEAPDSDDVLLEQRWEQDSSSFSFERIKRNPTDIATIVYSSGTYGQAKGCMLTNHNYLTQAASLSEMFPVDHTHTYFSFIPTNHAIDFMCGFFLPIMMGSKTIHQRTLRPEFIASTISEYRVTHMALVPMLLKNLQTKLNNQIESLPFYKRAFLKFLIKLNHFFTRKRPFYELSKFLLAPIHKKFGNSLQYIFVGGAFTDPDMAQFFYDLGFSVVIGYGLTEAGTVLTLNDLKPFRNDTVGKPLSITKIEVRNTNDQGVGQVWAQSPTVMKGYYKNDELTHQTIRNGWLHTGDLGHWDDDHLVLKGREKNMIVTSGGKNIYPEDIEHYFQNLPLKEYCVFAGSYLWPSVDLYRDHLIFIYHPQDLTKNDEIKELIRKQNLTLPEHKRISYMGLFGEDFPKTATMKIKRNALANYVQNLSPEKLLSPL